MPLVGNVNLDVLSERMVKNPSPTIPPRLDASTSFPGGNGTGGGGGRNGGTGNGNGSSEKLIVRWRTCGKTKGLGTGPNYKGIGARQRVDKITEWLGGGEQRDDEEFCGLFIFGFDEEGRTVSLVIARGEGGDGWDNGVGRVVGLTDWLLGRLGGREKEVDGLALGCCDLDGRRDVRRGRREI